MYRYASVDLGASSGRLIISFLDGNKIKQEEIHRFTYMPKIKNGHLCWDIDFVYENIISALKKCGEMSLIPDFLAIDTWGVDFALVDKDGKLIGDTVCYRDARTDGMTELFDKELLYSISGTQINSINTIFQLKAIEKSNPEMLERADKLLMIPDYLGYKLTGIMASEYTNASTTGLLDAEKKDYSEKLLSLCGAKKSLFPKIAQPSSVLGDLLSEIEKEIGYNLTVLHAASHDTASAVMAIPYDGKGIYISSGTWSLMGTELETPILSAFSLDANFTNEGGYGGKIRYLKNIMGLWMIQSVKREWEIYSFGELSDMARKCGDVGLRVNVNDKRFLAPESMAKEICLACGRELSKPEILSVIYHSLASEYAKTANEISEITGNSYGTINIIGGGSRDEYLNKLCALYSGKTVKAGPIEATALGNALSQMIYTGEIKSAQEGREIIKNTFEIKEYSNVTL